MRMSETSIVRVDARIQGGSCDLSMERRPAAALNEEYSTSSGSASVFRILIRSYFVTL